MTVKRLMLAAMGLLVLASAASSFASQDPMGTPAQVVGNAHFERRYTFVPLHSDILCRGQPCPKSEPYWALVLENNGVHYEMDHQFSMGKTISPELVEVLGTIIRPGSRVMLDGEVEAISDSYAVVTHVRRAWLVMDMEQ